MGFILSLYQDLAKLLLENIYIVAVVVIWLMVYMYFDHRKNTLKKTIFSSFEEVSSEEQSDMYLQYYKEAQLLGVYKVLITIGAVILLVANSDSRRIQGLAIGIGAIILVFQTLILSFVIYLMLASNYKVGETVRVGQLGQGEIIHIKPLYFGIAGKNHTGEHTGEFFLIPNNKVRENPIIRVDYNPISYQKIEFYIYYGYNDFNITFEDFFDKLTDYLDEYLPLRSAKNVGHFKSYIGYRYKLDLDYSDHATVKITIAFVSKQKVGYIRKHNIIAFVESLRTITHAATSE